MVTKYIIGHKSPDTDTTCSSIVYSNYLNRKNIQNEVCKLGELNNETKFVLKKFNVEIPQTKTELEEGSQIILMDHNEAKQSIDNREKYKIVQIIDHHKFDISTKEPLNIRAEAIGSTCSILAKIFFEENVELTKEEASMLLSAIISDTLYFRSPTTTKEDIELAKKLNEIAKIENLEEYSLEMFAAKSDLGDMEVEKLIRLDYKEFNFNNKKFGIGVMETTNPQYGINRKDEIIKKLKEIKKNDNLDAIFLSIIDIINENNQTIFPDEEVGEILKNVYGAEIKNNIADLKRTISRKKQIVPKLEDFYQK
ncbi:MAG: manganese-dependent inorganic pyrophosphatase [Nanoarchaeota archaeon]|nr:manganese-dependent inorganic pyrophosphatase [Nanoarchaeota archaeon]